MQQNCALTDEKLDELFVKEVGSVTQIVEKLPRNNVLMSTCARWFKIFQQATPEEKFSRNCMLLLLHKQLNDNGNLSYPFTDSRSCQRDLRSLHQMSMTLQHTMVSIDDDANESNCSMEYSSAVSPRTSAVCSEENALQRLNNANKLLAEQNAALFSELQVLQAEKEKQLKRRQSLLDKVESLRDYNKMYGKEVSYMKQIFACSALTALKLFAEPLFAEQPQYFVTLFSVLCEDQEDRAHFEQLDEQLGRIWRAHMDHYLRVSMQDQISRAYDEVRAHVSSRYKKMHDRLKATQMQELSLTAMRYLLLLRELFLQSYRGNKRVQQAVVEFLQERHNELAEGL